MMLKKNIGILALQGSFSLHQKKIIDLAENVTLIKDSKQFKDIAGLIIPGGESTTFLKLLTYQKLYQGLKDFLALQKPVLATCAGLILIAKKVIPKQQSLQVIDIEVMRNGYGRQIDSFITETNLLGRIAKNKIEAVFIRAPKIIGFGSNVEILASIDQNPIAVIENNIIGCTFHPELSQDNTIYNLFLTKIRENI